MNSAAMERLSRKVRASELAEKLADLVTRPVGRSDSPETPPGTSGSSNNILREEVSRYDGEVSSDSDDASLGKKSAEFSTSGTEPTQSTRITIAPLYGPNINARTYDPGMLGLGQSFTGIALPRLKTPPEPGGPSTDEGNEQEDMAWLRF